MLAVIVVKVSVIMPSLNVASYIEECIESVLGQDLNDIEIICIDAGSTDGTKELLKNYEHIDNRIRIIDSPVRSYGYQINLGIRESVGEYISIVETDDYIAPNMLSYLYEQAKQYDADVSKADYERFYLDDKGEKIFATNHLFSGSEKKYYGCRIGKEEVPERVYYDDANIWCSIYRRSFLIDKNIHLNESAGAAFQDIGFMQQIHMFADSMVFSSIPLYYYRTDRIASSINNSNWLRNVYQEFEFISNSNVVKTKEWMGTQNLFVNRILCIYISALQNAIINTNFEIDNVHWRPYYEKFRPVIKSFIDDYVIIKSKILSDLKIPLLLSIYSLKSYRDYVKVKYDDMKRKKKYLLQQCLNKVCIIFGSGVRGKKVCTFLRDNGVKITAFWDNDKSKWGTEYQDIPIVQPKSMSADNVAAYVVAIRGGRDAITKQLKELGVIEENIYYFDW